MYTFGPFAERIQEFLFDTVRADECWRGDAGVQARLAPRSDRHSTNLYHFCSLVALGILETVAHSEYYAALSKISLEGFYVINHCCEEGKTE